MRPRKYSFIEIKIQLLEFRTTRRAELFREYFCHRKSCIREMSTVVAVVAVVAVVVVAAVVAVVVVRDVDVDAFRDIFLWRLFFSRPWRPGKSRKVIFDVDVVYGKWDTIIFRLDRVVCIHLRRRKRRSRRRRRRRRRRRCRH